MSETTNAVDRAGRQKITITIRGEEIRLTKREGRALIGQLAGKLRGYNAGGRPFSEQERCPCGAMPLARAKRRYHHCEPSGEKGKS
jgi:hypothetical protein